MVFHEILFENEYAAAAFIAAAFLAFSSILHFFLKNYLKRITERTKSELDDAILKIITKPLHAFVLVIGLFIALRSLSTIAPYLAFIERVFFVISVFLVSMMVSKIFALFIGRWLRVKKRYEKTPLLINKIVSVVVYLIAFIIILDYFQIEITPLVATLGIGGLAIGLALQNTLSNFFAGLHIISDRPINVGDFIELQGVDIKGYVEDIGWRSTRIRTLPNNLVIIPNSKLAESILTNYAMPQHEMSVVIQCGVAYTSELKKVEKVTIDVARKIQKTVPGAVKAFEPFIRYHTFGDSNINFSVILRIEDAVQKYAVTHEFIKALKERYDKEGIEISWPVRKIYHGK